MRMRLVVAGFVLGLGWSMACGPAASPTGTSLFVRVFFNPGLGTRALVFSGTDKNSLEVFPRSQRPETIDGGAFTSPQTVRILLVNSLAGQALSLTVLGVTETNESVESGSADVTPALNAEKELEVRLQPFREPGDGGSDGGLDFDAGLLADGGNPDGGACRCMDGGCCSSSTGDCVIQGAVASNGIVPPIPVVACGPAGRFCGVICPLGRADHCANGACACGPGGVCAPGQICIFNNGGFMCVCNEWSCPNGCCRNNACVSHSTSSCGTAGMDCDLCASTLLQCGNGTCAGCINSDNTKCCSGSGSQDVHFPICRGANGVCLGCDPERSDRCGISTGTCNCGEASGPCDETHQCRHLPDGSGRCEPINVTLPH